MSVQNACPGSLLAHGDSIRELCPDDQSIAYNSAAWEASIGERPEFAIVHGRFPCTVSRSDLRMLSGEAISDDALLGPLFVAAMVFGFGRVGYGPYRTSIMLGGLSKQPALLTTVKRLLLAGDIEGAHRTFDLERCRTPFLSKMLYALGLGADLDPLPLILDDRVYRALDTLHGRGEVDQWRYYDRSRWTSAGYARYVYDVNAWARDLDCQPDQIEMYLFRNAAEVP